MPGFAGTVRKPDRYNGPHQSARARAFAALPEYSRCCRCGHVMNKHAKDRLGRSALHYDHAEDGTYLGFSHRTCNLRAGASKGGRVANAKTRRSQAGRGKAGRPTTGRTQWHTGTCEYCGNEWRSQWGTQRTCSVKCRWALHNSKRVARYVQLEFTVCALPDCNGIKIRTNRSRYCSRACSIEANARMSRDRYRAREGLPFDPAVPTSRMRT